MQYGVIKIMFRTSILTSHHITKCHQEPHLIYLFLRNDDHVVEENTVNYMRKMNSMEETVVIIEIFNDSLTHIFLCPVIKILDIFKKLGMNGSLGWHNHYVYVVQQLNKFCNSQLCNV